jgi:hypothetical protein
MATAEPTMKSRWNAQEHLREWSAVGERSRLSRRKYLRAIPIYPAYALHSPIGGPNSGFCRTRLDNMRIRSRIERLEDEMLPLPAGPPVTLNLQYVDADGQVVGAKVIEVPQVQHCGRRWRRYRGSAAKRDW